MDMHDCHSTLTRKMVWESDILHVQDEIRHMAEDMAKAVETEVVNHFSIDLTDLREYLCEKEVWRQKQAGSINQCTDRSDNDKNKSGLVILTTGIVKESGGEPVWYNSRSVAVGMNDILLITDYEFGFSGTSCGSEIRLKTNPQTIILVQESIEEILEKIADAKGE